MFLLLRIVLFTAMLISAGWLWIWLEPHAGDLEKMSFTAGDMSAVTRAGPNRQASLQDHGAAPANAGMPLEVAPAVQPAAFRFDRVIIDPIDLHWLPEHVVVGDVTGDRRPDVVMSMSYIGSSSNQGRVSVRIYAQMPNGSLSPPIEVDIDRAINSGHGLELADLDGNGIPEIALSDETGLTVISKAGAMFGSTWYPGIVPGRYLAAVDADGDGRLDLFAQSWEYGAEIFLGDGQGAIRDVSSLRTSYAAYATVESSDFTADGFPDVIVQTGYDVRIYPSLPQSGLQPPILIDLEAWQARPGYGITVADVNKDGKPDLVITDQGDNVLNPPKGVRVLYRGQGNDFTHSVLLDSTGLYTNPGAVRVADLDGNGYPDVVTMFDSYDRMGYFLQGPSGFAQVVQQVTDDDGYTNNAYGDNSFAIGDVNSDGCPDVVLAEVSSSLRIFYGKNCHKRIRLTGGRLPPLKG